LGRTHDLRQAPLVKGQPLAGLQRCRPGSCPDTVDPRLGWAYRSSSFTFVLWRVQ
jgi:hypothetical protein